MTLLHSETFAGWARGHLLCRVDGITDRFALTFDDGPGPHTPAILDTLTRHGAHATFFTLAGNSRRDPGVLWRMHEEGHEVAAHGDLHWPLPLLLPMGIRREIQQSVRAIQAAGLPPPRFYRPPFGFMMPGQASFVRGLGVEPVLGDVYPEDPMNPGAQTIVDRVMTRLHGGSIVILHDGSAVGQADRRQTVKAVDSILTRASSVGLRAVTVGALLEGTVPRWTLGIPLRGWT